MVYAASTVTSCGVFARFWASLLAVFSAECHVAPQHPPDEATLRTLERMLKAEVGTCRLGDWEAFGEVDGTAAGWMTTVRGRGVAGVVEALGEG